MTRRRLVSLNAWGGQEWSSLQDWLPKVAPDILCLQEVTRAPVPSPGWLRYVDPHRDLQQRADLFADVSACLPEHQSYFAPATRGTLHDAVGRPYASEHGQAVWVARDLAASGQWQGFIHGQYRPDGWGPEPVPRSMQIFRICDPGSGGHVVCAHFHGLRDPSGKGDLPARRAQAERVRDALMAFRAPEEALILAGDFNLLPDSESFDIWAPLGLRNLIVEHGITDTRTALYTKPGRYADYLLASDGVDISAFAVPATPIVSDHRPLILDFTL